MKTLLLFAILIFSLLISGCAIENATTQSDTGLETDGETALVEPYNKNTALEESKNFCYNLEDKNWRNSCLAFVENNSNNCIYFDSLGFNYYSTENCFWDFGIYVNDSYCDEVNGTRKYFCKAIANNDENYCAYMDTEKSELSCINFLQSTEENQIVGDDVDEYLKSKNENISKKIEDCLLLRDEERNTCLTDFALRNNDFTVCDELSDKSRDNCFRKYGIFSNVSVCLEIFSSYETALCVFSAITSMDRTKQDINVKICDEFLDKNTKNDCYLRYAMMKFRSG